MDHRLVKGAVEKDLKRVSRPALIEGFSPLIINRVPVRSCGVSIAQIRVENLSKAFQVRKKIGGVDH